MVSGSVKFIDVDGFRKQSTQIALAEVTKFAAKLAESSQAGATGQYKRSWAAFVIGVDVALVNTASHALQALVGISPEEASKGSREQKINSITEWVRVILGINDEGEARNVARAILDTHIRSGSVQYQRGDDNLLGLDPVSRQPSKESPVFAVAEKIAARINALKL